MEFETKYEVTSSAVHEYDVVGEDDEYFYLVPPKTIFKIRKPAHLYDDKEKAQYQLFVKRRRNGTPLRNFKSSKYNKMYIERAKIENPELLL